MLLHILLFLFSAGMLVLSALLLCSLLKIRSLVSTLLSSFLFSLANVVLTCTLAGFFHQLSNRNLFILIHLIILVCLYLYWKKKGSPALLNVKVAWASLGQFFKRIFRSRELLILFCVVCASALFQFVLILVMPPNTHDSMTTHLSRVGYWLQNNSYFPFNIHNAKDIYYPFNPAFEVLWTIVLLGNDMLVEISQYLALFICAFSIYGFSRLLHLSEKNAFFNALIFFSFPIIVMQATTTQTDLFVAAIISCAFYFLALAFQQKEQKFLALSALAIALALGSKQTAFFLLPGYLLTFLALWLKKRKEIPHAMRTFLLSMLLFFLVFGSLTYLVNFSYYHGFFGPPSAVEAETKILNAQDLFEVIRLNSLRLTYNFIDPSGMFSPWKNYFVKAKAHIFKAILEPLHIELESTRFVATKHVFKYIYVPHLTEDEAWYGPLGAFLLFLAFWQGLIQGIKKKDPLRLGVIFSGLVYFFCIILFRPGYDIFQGRYFISVAVLLIPLLQLSFSETFLPTLLRYLTVIFAVILIITTHLFNEGKPVAVIEKNPSLIRESIWNMDRIEKMTVQNRDLRDPLKSTAHFVPNSAVLGLCIDVGVWDYPFFREDFSQKVVPIYPKELLLDKDWLEEQKIEFVVMNTTQKISSEIPDFLILIFDYNNWKLLQVQN